MAAMTIEEIRKRLKELLVSELALEDIKPEEIKDDEVLFGEGLALDSLDAVEIVVILQRHFGVEISDMEKGKEVFRSLETLSRYVYENQKK